MTTSLKGYKGQLTSCLPESPDCECKSVETEFQTGYDECLKIDIRTGMGANAAFGSRNEVPTAEAIPRIVSF